MSFMGIDIGTHSTKACLVNRNCQMIYYEALHAIHNLTINSNEVLKNIECLIRKLNATESGRFDPPTHVCISSLGEAIIPVELDMSIRTSVLGPNSMGAKYLETIETNNDLAYCFDRDSRNYYYSVFKIKSLLDEKKINLSDRIYCWEDYCFKLWSGQATMGDTLALRTGAYNFQRQSWNTQLLTHLGLPEDLFSNAQTAGTLIGCMSRTQAQHLGFPKPPILIQGGWDQYCAAVGCCLIPGQVLVNFGSVLILITLFNKNSAGHICHSVSHERFLTEFGLLDVQLIYAPGLLISAVESLSGRRDLCKAIEPCPIKMKTLLTVDLERQMIIDPSFYPHPVNEDSFSRFDPLEVITAIFEASAFEIRRRLEQFQGVPLKKIIVGGGGACSQAWCQILGWTLNRPIVVPSYTQASVLGAALISQSRAENLPLNSNLGLTESNCIVEANSEGVEVFNNKYTVYLNWLKFRKENKK